MPRSRFITPYGISLRLAAACAFFIAAVKFRRNFVTAPKETLVGSSGLEPPTSRLSGARSNHLSYEPIVRGGDERVRTDDPLLAKQVLSQLSYTPKCNPVPRIIWV